MDENSFYTPIEGKKEFKPSEVDNREPDFELRQEKLRRIMEKMQRVLNPEKINKYVNEQMGNREKMLATQLPLETADDFVKVIYIRLYGQRKNMTYSIEMQTEKKINGFQFQDFLIQKKGE